MNVIRTYFATETATAMATATNTERWKSGITRRCRHVIRCFTAMRRGTNSQRKLIESVQAPDCVAVGCPSCCRWPIKGFISVVK